MNFWSIVFGLPFAPLLRRHEFASGSPRLFAIRHFFRLLFEWFRGASATLRRPRVGFSYRDQHPPQISSKCRNQRQHHVQSMFDLYLLVSKLRRTPYDTADLILSAISGQPFEHHSSAADRALGRRHQSHYLLGQRSERPCYAWSPSTAVRRFLFLRLRRYFSRKKSTFQVEFHQWNRCFVG